MSLLEQYAGRIGETVTSDWFEVDQARVNAFADVTLDHQFIHVDPKRAAKETPFGGPIAHGFLTLSLLSHFAESTLPPLPGKVIGINYGFDKVRFLSPVRVGSRIRGKFTLAKAEERKPGQIQLVQSCSVEIEGTDTPALAAEWLSLIVYG
ncbi:nodulation protein N [Glycocaulis alkaliphilus]|uniref:Nodulation protein N n=1 Tax=Glycocaulis alkaliphilus TaxID=1434191 RepID=A0A3T0EC83_9PROT|nr:MaoC family dehydratase [Glycocaulis alkaliphilus]AZU04905.1 nodulation protein N [Glycocaulis alkaliphilus]GGB66750.1 nodulation protein NodN [Glycocaulis alkaliphilus]